jgi:UDP-glucose 4-epimerase
MSRVLVTGSAGFIGGYLVAELLSHGHTVVGVDDFSKYGPARSAFGDHPGFRFVEGDAADVTLMTGLLRDCDHFIAAAALVGGIGYFHRRCYDLLAANQRITAAACDAAIAARQAGRLRKVTYISSSMVYERAGAWPSEEGQQLEIPPPASSYGFSKLAVEYFARAAWEQHLLPFTIIRPFNCVGAGEARALGEQDLLTGNVGVATSHVVPDLVRKLLAGQDPLRILGSGGQVRHYTYGGDLAAGIVTSLDHPGALCEDFNLAAERGTTVLELATMLWRKIRGPDDPPRIAHDPPYRHDVQRRVPGTGKAARVLGFRASTPLEDVLDEVIAWTARAMRAGVL